MTPANFTPNTPWLFEPSLPHFTETFSPWRPKRSFFWRSFGMSFHGVSSETLQAFAAACAMLRASLSPPRAYPSTRPISRAIQADFPSSSMRVIGILKKSLV